MMDAEVLVFVVDDDPHMQELKAWSSFINLPHRQASY
jgi:hypothetical protein